MISQGFILIHYTQLADGLRWRRDKKNLQDFVSTDTKSCRFNTKDMFT